MRAAVALSVALFACAAAEQSSGSLRGGRALADAAEGNASAPAAANSTQPELLGDAELDAWISAHDALENSSEPLALLGSSSGWSQGGDKMWGSGRGIENVNSGNVGYYDRGMDAARSRCGGSGCALLTNPPGHRTVQQFHIHFIHYQGYGASLKHRLESMVCSSPGAWRGGHLPCGGRAAFFPGFPGVFSKAMSGGNIHHASVIAWPASCGGRGTIVELAYGCSIEHQIRGDYDPRRR